MKNVARLLVPGSLLCLWHSFFRPPYSAAAVRGLVPTTATTRLSARKFCSSALAHFWLVGISSLLCGDHRDRCRSRCHSPVGRGISPTGGNYRRRWTNFPPVAALAIAVPAIGFGPQPADHRLDPLRCAARPAGDTCRAAAITSVTEVAKGMGMSRASDCVRSSYRWRLR